MKFHVVILLCFALNTSIFGKRRRIIGGSVVDIKDFPYLASLRNSTSNKLFCGGSIITERHVLTAAHCLYEKNYSDIRIYVGSNYSMFDVGQAYSIETVSIHPNFTGNRSPSEGSRHDIAIVTLNEDILFNAYQRSGIIDGNDVNVGANAEIIGWGLTQFPSKVYSSVLRKASVTLIDNDKCFEKICVPISEEHICSAGNKKIGVCLADSGGPLIINDKIVGISSFCIPCAGGLPDVFVRIYKYLSFIRTIVNEKYKLNIS